MIRRENRHVAICVMMLGCMVGCVRPGQIDATLLNRYQQAMARRGFQQRGQEGLDLLRPTRGQTGPELKITKDPETHKARIELTLGEAVMRTLANNLEIRVVGFDPAISRQEMIKAAAEFDYVVFGGYTYDRRDERTDSQFGGGQTDTQLWQAGLKQKTVTGAEWSVAWSMTRTWDDQSFRTLSERFEPRLTLEVAQPLLRDAWPEFVLSRLRIARLNRQISASAFRQKVEEIINKVVSTYWALVQARREREIQSTLLDRTTETLRRVKARAGLDATRIEIKQAAAAVEIRRAALIRTEKSILDARDGLARLLADAQINVLTDYEIVPATPPVSAPVRLDATDQLLAALRHNPLLAQARLAIATADINVKVAANQALPRLDLTASIGYHGLGPTANEANEKFFTGDYVSYGVGLAFEYPLGNRAAMAALRGAKLERLKAVTAMQNTADNIAVAVNERIRQIRTAYQELQAQRAAVRASQAQLQGLEDIEQIRGRLTPEFLSVKLQAQEALANAELAQLRAIIEYNAAQADLARATGTVLQMHRVQLALPAAAGEANWPDQDHPGPPR